MYASSSACKLVSQLDVETSVWGWGGEAKEISEFCLDHPIL